MNRIREEYCVFTNPFNASQVSRISLKPSDVDVIVFWTKDAKPMLAHLEELDSLGYKYYFQYTINAYPKALEPNLPTLQDSVDTFRALSEKIGREKVIWRYDPIVFADITPYSYHIDNFSRLISELSGFTDRVIISVADEYRSANKRLVKQNINYTLPQPGSREFAGLIQALANIAKDSKIQMFSCAELIDLTPYGISPGKCIDNEYIKNVFHIDVTGKKDKSQRKECGCVISKDIGQYDTCVHHCLYCYATKNDITAVKNYQSHNTKSALLIENKAYKEETALKEQLNLL